MADYEIKIKDKEVIQQLEQRLEQKMKEACVLVQDVLSRDVQLIPVDYKEALLIRCKKMAMKQKVQQGQMLNMLLMQRPELLDRQPNHS